MTKKENILELIKPLPIIFIIIFIVGGYFVENIEQYDGFTYWLVIIGLGIGGLIMARGLIEKKYRTIWFALAASILGIITGLLIEKRDKTVEWSIINVYLGTFIGYSSHVGYKKIIIGAVVGLLIAIVAGTKMSFDGNKIENEALHIIISMLNGILIGGFWGSLFENTSGKNK